MPPASGALRWWQAVGGQGAGVYTRALLVGGHCRTVRLHVPASLDRIEGSPLLVVLHYGSGNGMAMDGLTGFSSLAERRRFVLAYPQAHPAAQGYWNDGRLDGVDDVGFNHQLLTVCREVLGTHPDRAYVAGFSNGASMANCLTAIHAPEIAGLAAVAGTIGRGLASRWQPTAPVPVVYFHGTEDPFVYYFDGGSAGTWRGSSLSAQELASWWAQGNGCDTTPEARELPAASQDGTSVVRLSFRSRAPGREVVLYRINGGGHTWPGTAAWTPQELVGRTNRLLQASDLIWNFFERHQSASRTG